MTHDYKRNGTTTLFAAINTRSGKVMGMRMQKHRHQEWLRFLREIKRATPADQQIHIICDNYATHEHATVQRWLGRCSDSSGTSRRTASSARDILQKVTRARKSLDSIQSV